MLKDRRTSTAVTVGSNQAYRSACSWHAVEFRFQRGGGARLTVTSSSRHSSPVLQLASARHHGKQETCAFPSHFPLFRRFPVHCQRRGCLQLVRYLILYCTVLYCTLLYLPIVLSSSNPEGKSHKCKYRCLCLDTFSRFRITNSLQLALALVLDVLAHLRLE